MLSWLFQRKPGGFVAGCGIERWWLEALNDEQRKYIKAKCGGALSAYANFDHGPVHTAGMTPKAALASLAGWFTKDDERMIGRQIMEMAEACPESGKLSVLDRHFMLSGMITFYYRCRKDAPHYLPLCEQRCRDQIEMAPQARRAFLAEQANDLKKAGIKPYGLPGHEGYFRLHFLLKKRQSSEAAIIEAQRLKEGWGLESPTV